MNELQTISNILAVGIILFGLALAVVLYRYARTVDRAAHDARFWQAQAQREAAVALQLRRQFLPDPPPLRQAPIDPNPRQRFDPTPPTIPVATQPAVVRRPAPVPPIAQQTGETLVLPRTIVGGDEEPQSRPIGTRTRSRRTAGEPT